MNKNDLRFKKTETAIKNAYLHLKKIGNKPIKVTELCKKAMINKTTFYAHYETIDALKKRVCFEYVADILKSCPQINDIKTDIKSIVYATHIHFLKNEKAIYKLYEHDIDAFINDVEKLALEAYIDENLSEEKEIAIRFCIGGAFRLLILNKNEEQINKTIQLIEKFVSAI